MTKEEKIKKIELELENLKSSDEDEELTKHIAELKKQYLGKAISINNIEEGCYYIYKVKDIDDDGGHAIFHGRGVFFNNQNNAVEYTDEDIEAVSFYDDIEVYNDVEALKSDIMETFKWTIDNDI